MEVEIKEVTDKKGLKAFVKFNIELYKDSPYHVPGLIADELITLSKEKNPAFDFCETKYFLAYKDGKIAGRIAGIINHRSNEVWNQQYARFGFVDFIDDSQVAEKLFQAVESWAKSNGMTAMHGPLGFTDLDHEGLLVEGFDHMATMATSYTYPYYPEHIERLGYVKDQDWLEYWATVPKKVPERYARIAEVARRRNGLKVVKFRKTKEIWPYAYKLFALWNKAYAPLYAYVPLSEKQIEYYVKMYIPMLRLNLISLVVREADDEVVGLGICMPNLSIPLRKARGKLFPFGLIPLLKTLHGKRVKVADMMMIGVDPEYQNKGVNAIIFADMISELIKLDVDFCESNPELELNSKIQSHWEYFEATNHKKRRAYIKHL
jgi:GNAT superfamily N-acetyltransferase